MSYGDADWQYEQITRLSGEVEALQYQLITYHEWLERCLERDREKQLLFTWSILTILSGIFAAVMTVDVLQDSFGLNKALSGIGGLFAYIAITVWSGKLEESDLKNLPQLPKWDPKT